MSRNKNTIRRFLCPLQFYHKIRTVRNFIMQFPLFFRIFGIGKLLRKCNAQKEKGVPVLDIFKYKLCNVFSDRSMYMQQKTGSFREAFSKNTFYRFLNNPKTNWLRFTTLLSKEVARSVDPLPVMTV